MSDMDEMLNVLHKLTTAERRQLRARLEALTAVDAPAAVKDESLVYEVLCDIVQQHGGGRAAPYGIMRGHSVYKTFALGAEVTLQYVRTNFKPTRRAELQRALQLVLGLCARHIEQHQLMGVSVKAMCGTIVRVNEIVERSFPGYRAAGVLPVVMEKMVHGKVAV